MNILDYAASVPTPADWTAAFQQAMLTSAPAAAARSIGPRGRLPHGRNPPVR